MPEHNPSAFVSWAHSSPGWPKERTTAWQEEVVEFVRVLRRSGIDADIDLHHFSERGADWTRFGPRAIADTDWVVVALSPSWRERWEGRNAPNVGAGAAAEADALYSIYHGEGQDILRSKLVLVILPSMLDEDVVPTGLHGPQRFRIRELSVDGVEDLLRLLTDQPRHPAEPLGTVPDLPAALGPTERTEPHPIAARETPNGSVTERDALESPRLRPLIAALSDRDGDVRYEAMSALRNRLGPELLPVIEPLMSDRDNYIRRMAVEYYAALTGPEGANRIVTALSDTDGDVRYEAMSALRNRLGPELLPVIEPLISDRDDYIRRMAIEYYSALT